MATPKDILKAYKSSINAVLSDIGNSRAGQTVSGGAKNSLASDVNAGATIYDMTQGARDTMMSGYISDSASSLNQAKKALAQLEREGASAWEIENQQTVVNSLQRQYDAMSRAGAVQRGATQATYQLADDIKDSAAASIGKAKNGLGYIGQTAVDIGEKLTEIGIDKAKSLLLVGALGPNFDMDKTLEKLADSLKLAPLAARSYGSNSQAARQDSADVIDASLYGLVTAIADTKIEDALDGLMGAYGVGKFDVQFKSAFKRLAKNATGKKLLGIAASIVGEGLEGFVGNVVNQTLKSLYNGKDSIQNFSETAWDKALYNALVDGIIGISGGVKSEIFTK